MDRPEISERGELRGLYFGAGQFGWFHLPARAAIRSCGIVLCPPIGYELILSHRGMRCLAVRLAGEGYPVLRMDYRGTGDSAGQPPEGLDPWIDDIHAADKALRDLADVQSVVLVGMRMGGTLALLAASRSPVSGLVLWEPCLIGKNYLREARVMAMTGPEPSDPSRPGDGFAYAGFCLPSRSADEVKQFDSRNVDLLGNPPVLMLNRDDLPGPDKLKSFREPGRVEVQRPAGYTGVMAEPHANEVPHETIGSIISWLAARESFDSTSPAGVQPLLGERPRGTLELAEGLERLFKAGGGDLFGILTEPKTPLAQDLPIILLLNAGSVHRIGPHRVYVDLARELALRGFSSCRVDLAGIGDSPGVEGNKANDPYASSAVPSVNAFMAALEREVGARSFIPIGLCSGAYASFHTALESDRVKHSVLINPLTFYWYEGMSLDQPTATSQRSAGPNRRAGVGYLKRLLAEKAPVLRNLAKSIMRSPEVIRARAAWFVHSTTGAPVRGVRLPSDLKRLSDRNVFLQIFFATHDPGHLIIATQAGPVLRKMLRHGQAQLRIFDGADHTFTDQGHRRRLVNTVVADLRNRYSSGDLTATVVNPADSEWSRQMSALENLDTPPPLAWRNDWEGDSRLKKRAMVTVCQRGELQGGLVFESAGVRSLPGHVEIRVSRAGGQSPDVFRAALAALMKHARRSGSVLRMWIQTFDRDLQARREMSDILLTAGFHPAAVARSYSHTAAIDLGDADDEALMSRLRSTARRDIRRSLRLGLTVRVLTDPEHAVVVSRIYRDTMLRGGRIPVPIDWARVISGSAARPEWSRISAVFLQNDPDKMLAFAWTMLNGVAVTYDVAGSVRDPAIVVPLAYPLVWDGLRWGRDIGATWFDFGGGLAQGASATDALHRIDAFKRHFSHNVIEVSQEWEWSPRPHRARLAEKIRGFSQLIVGIRKSNWSSRSAGSSAGGGHEKIAEAGPRD